MGTRKYIRVPPVTQGQTSYHDEFVPNADEFRQARHGWRKGLAKDGSLRQKALELQRALDDHHYTYQFDWLGVPIVRLPDDIVVLQEIIHEEKPDSIVETGVARGGSVILSASIQEICGLVPRVLGIDLTFFPHTLTAIQGSRYAQAIKLLEASSTAADSITEVSEFLQDSKKALLILDSDHSHSHVLTELQALGRFLPTGSLILVADTVVEEMPDDYFPDRHWGVGNSPLTAVNQFLEEDSCYEREQTWNRRAIISEFRDGILRKTS